MIVVKPSSNVVRVDSSSNVTVLRTNYVVTVSGVGLQGPTGVVAANAPATYDSGTQKIGVAVGTTAGTVAAGNDSRIVNAATVSSVATVQTNIDAITGSFLRGSVIKSGARVDQSINFVIGSDGSLDSITVNGVAI